MNTVKTSLLNNIKKYNEVILVSIFSIIIYTIAALYNNRFEEIMPVASFLTWHNIFEFASVLISFSIFTVTYFIYAETGSLNIIILGCAFFLMGSLDTFHTFSYKGMAHFFIANETANRATTLWILSRLLGNLGFITAISISSDLICKIKKQVFAIGTAFLAIILFLIVTYYPDFFPTMYIEEEGITTIKIILEYIIILITAISFILLAGKYRKSNSKMQYSFMIALVLLIFSEFSFTSYGSTYDAFNYIGHLYKIIAFTIFYRVIYIENVSTPIRELIESKDKLKKYSENLNIIVKERTNELEKLNGKLLTDLEYAKEMQRCLLPAEMPKDIAVSFDVEYIAADNLSGDFYNVVRLDENNIALYIGDVSGHGISAAMLTVFAYQNVIHLKEKDQSVGEIIEPGFVLKTLYKSYNRTNFPDEKYILMLYGIYNTKDKSFKYSSAGINVPPYIIKESGEIHEIDTEGFPICKLGGLVSPFYKNKSIQLEKGDKLLFYSDGLIEAKNENNESYGLERLRIFLKNNYALNSSELNMAIKKDFRKHLGDNNKLLDDATFLSMMIVN